MLIVENAFCRMYSISPIRSSVIHTHAAIFYAAVPHASSHLLSAGPRAMLARRTNVAARGIGILTSCAEVDGCWLLKVNRRTAEKLS